MRWSVGLLLCLLAWPAISSSGSWVASSPSVRVSVPDRTTSSKPISSASTVPVASTITRLGWRYDAPTGQPLEAWLCHPARCIPLASASGQTEAMSGLSASAPLHFRFRLPRGGRAVEIKGLQVIVSYR